MFPFLPLITELLPGFTSLLSGSGAGGDGANAVIERMIDAIKEKTSKDTPDQAKADLDGDAAKKFQLQQQLAQIALDELKEQNRAKEEAAQIDLELYRLEMAEREQNREAEFTRYLRDLQDRQDARSVQTKLADDHSPLAWVAPILAFVLVGLLFYLLHGIMVAREPVVNKDVFNVVLGALVTAFTTVVSFYFGSSVGSRQKDDALKSGKLIPNPGGTSGTDPGGASPGASPPASPSDGRTPGTGSGTPTTPKPVPLPPSTGPVGTFRETAPRVMNDLVRELRISSAQAAGILGNIGVESGGFRFVQELRPISGRGGLGWCQWTGPRRRTFEAWMERNGKDDARKKDPSSYEANFGFLLFELANSEAPALASLRRKGTVDEATDDFMRKFERPGVENLPQRLSFGRLALNEYGRTFGA